MANQTKLADRGMPSPMRYVTWASSELATGDVLRVLDSLGRMADTLSIDTTAGCDLSIRINSRITVLPIRSKPEDEASGWTLAGYPNVALGTELETQVGSITIGDATSKINYQLNDVPIQDLEVTFTTGTFTILLS